MILDKSKIKGILHKCISNQKKSFIQQLNGMSNDAYKNTIMYFCITYDKNTEKTQKTYLYSSISRTCDFNVSLKLLNFSDKTSISLKHNFISKVVNGKNFEFYPSLFILQDENDPNECPNKRELVVIPFIIHLLKKDESIVDLKYKVVDDIYFNKTVQLL